MTRLQFQSTLPYGSDYQREAKYNDAFTMSIHAPLRERLKDNVISLHANISIHAPLRERRPRKDNYYWLCTNFNPRSLTGATSLPECSSAPARFQSTLPYGSDCLCNRINIHHADFNPRSLTGATPGPFVAKAAHRYFNPRSLTGATAAKEKILKHRQISIHAPLRERRLVLLQLTELSIFQSTLPYGSDQR